MTDLIKQCVDALFECGREDLAQQIQNYGEDLITREEAGRILQKSVRTVSRLLESGELTRIGKGSGSKIKRSEVIALRQSWENQS